jgi:enoyl-CoA hydratase/carnithine racemase
LVEQRFDAGVALITLQDPEHGNLLDPQSVEELASAFERSVRDPRARAVLLRSAGAAFCLGMDLGRLSAQAGSGGRAVAQRAVGRYADLLAAMFRAPLPVACLVQGEVKAGGVGLVCACDIVVATEAASFELGEVLFGLIPANVLPYLLALRVPPQKARYLVLSSARITASEALRLNLVDELLPAAGAERRLRELFGRLLRSSPRALSQAKGFTAQLIGRTPRRAAAAARRRLLRLLRDPQARQGVQAFRDGDLPPWFSRFKPAGPLALWRGPEPPGKEDRP